MKKLRYGIDPNKEYTFKQGLNVRVLSAGWGEVICIKPNKKYERYYVDVHDIKEFFLGENVEQYRISIMPDGTVFVGCAKIFPKKAERIAVKILKSQGWEVEE